MTTRVLHVVPSCIPEAGSIGVALAGMADALATHDVQSHVLSVNDDPPPAADGPQRLTPQRLAETMRAVDVAHVHGLQPKTARRCTRAARRGGAAVVVSPLGAFAASDFDAAGWRARWRRWLDTRYALRSAAAVGVLDTSERAHVERRGGRRTIRMCPGIDIARLPSSSALPDGWPAGEDWRCVLNLGPVHPDEGLVALMRAVAELGRDFRGWKLVLAGPCPGPWRDKLQATIERKGAGERIVMVGDVTLEEQCAMLRRSDVLVAASLRTRPPVSVMLAAAVGVPVVATPHGWPEALAPAVRTCAATRAGLREALGACIAQSRAERSALSAAARRIAAECIDWSAVATTFADVYRRVLEK